MMILREIRAAIVYRGARRGAALMDESLKDTWNEFRMARMLMWDHEDHAKFFERKRNEALTPEDYVFFSDKCNDAIKQQSDATDLQNKLHMQIVAAVKASGPAQCPI
jgi:hypothetical protein